MPHRIPNNPEDLTPAFLSELVAEVWPGVAIEETSLLKVKNYGEASDGKGVSTSRQVTIEVRYRDGAPERLPTQLLAKMSISDDVACSNPDLDVLFRNEIAFYTKLRRELDIEAPLGVGGRFDSETKRYVLLMDDLTLRGSHFNSMMDNDDVTVVESILETLAKLHARFWRSPRLGSDLAWIQGRVTGEFADWAEQIIHPHIAGELAREKFKREFVQETGATLEDLSALERALMRHYATLPQTVLHGDAHFGNTYALPNRSAGLYDWQGVARGFVMMDVGYLIQTALSVETRRKKERDLLAFYRDRLCSHGVVEPPSLETLWTEYRRSAVHGFYFAWLPASRENYGWEFMVVANHRTKAAFMDLETKKLLSGLV